MTLGDILKQYRDSNKISMDEFAKKSSLSKGYISMLENNINPRNSKPIAPTLPTIQKIATGMGTDIDSLLKMMDGDQKISLVNDEKGQIASKHNDYIIYLGKENISSKIENTDFIEMYNKLDDHGSDVVNAVLILEYNRCISTQKSIQSVQEDPRDIISLPHYQQLVSAGNGQVYYDDPSVEYYDVYLTPTNRLANFMVSVTGNSMEPLYRNEDTVYVQKMDAVDIGDIGIFLVDGEMYIKERGEDRLISRNKSCPDIPLSGKASVLCAGKVLGKCKELVGGAPYYEMDDPDIIEYFDATKHYRSKFDGAAASKGLDQEGYDILDKIGKDMKEHIDDLRKGKKDIE